MDQVSVCNTALGWLGVAQIASLDDPSSAAELCKANWDGAIAKLLEERAWTFATGWISVAPGALAPANPAFSKQFLLPSTVLRVLAADDGSGTCVLPWTLEGRYVLADVDPLKAKVVQVVDVSACSPGFGQALAAYLAFLLAAPLTENTTRQASMLQVYERAIREAARLDGMQGTPDITWLGPAASRRLL